jgi:ankyrin repeat protein
VLLQHGANVNQTDTLYGYKPLHRAAANGQDKCVEVLLKNGANSTIKNNKEKTALDVDKKGLIKKFQAYQELLLSAGYLREECNNLSNESTSFSYSNTLIQIYHTYYLHLSHTQELGVTSLYIWIKGAYFLLFNSSRS